jgi:hypothetical protein
LNWKFDLWTKLFLFIISIGFELSIIFWGREGAVLYFCFWEFDSVLDNQFKIRKSAWSAHQRLLPSHLPHEWMPHRALQGVTSLSYSALPHAAPIVTWRRDPPVPRSPSRVRSRSRTLSSFLLPRAAEAPLRPSPPPKLSCQWDPPRAAPDLVLVL